jgi:hypothetical protein
LDFAAGCSNASAAFLFARCAMANELDVYRHQIIRAVLGTHPAILAKEADPVALESLCRRLNDAEGAIQLLCKNGFAWPAQSLTDLVRSLLLCGKEDVS